MGRCFRYKDLYDNVLFNYQWLYHKMCALPLPEVLCDFEDAAQNIRLDTKKEDNIQKEIKCYNKDKFPAFFKDKDKLPQGQDLTALVAGEVLRL